MVVSNLQGKRIPMDALVVYWIIALILTCGRARGDPIGIVENYVLTDAARGRQVPIKVYYPQREHPGGYPIVIFSHGAELTKDRYEYLGRFWAESGYVVIHITHLQDGAIFIKHGKLLVSGSWEPYTKEAEDAVIDSPRVNRPLDITFVIDSLPVIAKAVPDLGTRMDCTRIGVAGHSFGAYTVIAVAGAVIHQRAGGTRGFGDSRIKTFIAMSLFRPEAPDSWALITHPIMIINGSKESEGVLKSLNSMPPGEKYCVTVTGVGHQDFFDDRLDGTPYHEFIKRVGLAFLDTALRDNDPSATGLARALAAEGIADDGGTLTGAGASGQLELK
jgi:predicted dienelactone hydrolase